MRNYYQHVILLVKRFLFVLFLYFISRIFFYVLNAGYFSGISFGDLFRAFMAGIRFDIAAIVFTNLFLLLFLLPGSYKNNHITLKTGGYLFFAVNAIALLSNFMDARFFDFINKRSTSSVFTLLGSDRDIWLLIPRFLRDYWYVAVSWLMVVVFFGFAMPRMKQSQPVEEKLTPKHFSFQMLIFSTITGFMLLGARGTRLKPISMVDAASYTDLKNIPLVLNTPFSIIKTLDNENLAELNYFPQDELESLYNPVHHIHNDHPFKKLNVVIFILESFSSEYCGFIGSEKGFTPNLDSLLSQSLVFQNAYANGTQSYEAMAAIIAGIPSLMERPYGGSNYADNFIETLPRLLREKGYHTSFFHGGNNGTMGFKNFARIAGIDQYIGRNEYNNDEDYDGYWGIRDEPFLQYFAHSINAFPEPFITSVFTLSSHHPYIIPEKYKHQFKEGKLPILKSIAYADYALGSFFKTARQMAWFNNTLFVFTADHAAQAIETRYNSTTGMFSIPLAFYFPADSTMKGIDATIGQQIDIMPTILDYLNYDGDYFAFGESLLDTTAPHRCISYVNGIYQLIQNGYVMQFDGKKITSFFQVDDEQQTWDVSERMSDPEVKKIYDDMHTALKAILQTYNHLLITNRTSLSQNMNSNAQISFEFQSKQLP